MKKQSKNGVQTKSNFTKGSSEQSTSKESNRQKSEGRDWSKRGGAIKKAMQNVRCIRDTIENLTRFAPQMIGEDLRSRWSDKNTPQEQWAKQVVELFYKFEDDILLATIAYEDAVFFPETTEEEP